MRAKMILTAAMALALAVPVMASAQQGTGSGQTSGQAPTRQQSQLPTLRDHLRMADDLRQQVPMAGTRQQ